MLQLQMALTGVALFVAAAAVLLLVVFPIWRLLDRAGMIKEV